MNIVIDGIQYSDNDLRMIIEDARRWDAFRNQNISAIRFYDIADHSFPGGSTPTMVDSIGDFLTNRYYGYQ